MRGTVVCLAVIYGFLGTAGPAACLCAASVPARGSASFASMDPMRNAPGWGTGQAAHSPVCSAKSCTSLEQVYEQAQRGDAESQLWLARQYESGSCGLCKDDPLAVVWLKKAAEADGQKRSLRWGCAAFSVLVYRRILNRRCSCCTRPRNRGMPKLNTGLQAVLRMAWG